MVNIIISSLIWDTKKRLRLQRICRISPFYHLAISLPEEKSRQIQSLAEIRVSTLERKKVGDKLFDSALFFSIFSRLLWSWVWPTLEYLNNRREQSNATKRPWIKSKYYLEWADRKQRVPFSFGVGKTSSTVKGPRFWGRQYGRFFPKFFSDFFKKKLRKM